MGGPPPAPPVPPPISVPGFGQYAGRIVPRPFEGGEMPPRGVPETPKSGTLSGLPPLWGTMDRSFVRPARGSEGVSPARERLFLGWWPADHQLWR